MSLTDKWEQRGLKQGIEQGIEKGRQESLVETAKRMLALGADDAFILKVTGLTQEELDAVKKQK